MRSLIRIFDQQSNRRTGGLAIEDARQNLHLIRFVSLRSMPGPARAPSLKVLLDIGLRQVKSGRTAVDHAAERGAVTLTEGGYCKKPPERIT
jgi:hypothetical protein